jgi:hypothetical protein
VSSIKQGAEIVKDRAPQFIDPRGPRFGAAITGALVLVTFGLAVSHGPSTALGPDFYLFALVGVSFAVGAIRGVHRHPYGRIFKALVRPRLAPPAELEDSRPPTFAQGVGLLIVAIGVVLALAGVPYAIAVTSAAAFIAAFLNSVFGYCLGCQLYLLLLRAGIIRQRATNPAV